MSCEVMIEYSELFLGAWVEPRSNGVPAPDMQVVGLFSDVVYCEVDPEQGDPFEYTLKEVFPIRVVEKVLEGNFFTYLKDADLWVRECGSFRLECKLMGDGQVECTVYRKRGDRSHLTLLQRKTSSRILHRCICVGVHQLQQVLLRYTGMFAYNSWK